MMKSRVVRIYVAAVFSFGLVYGTPTIAQGLQKVNAVSSYHVLVSDNKTSNIIFPYAVKSVDRGSGDIIAQVVQGFGNVLQLKANAPGFQQTNITVITSDGKFYSFLVDYTGDPKVLNLSFKNDGSGKESMALPDDYNTKVLNDDAEIVFHAKSFLHKHTFNQQMKLRLAAIYLKDNLMWFKVSVGNHSQVNFDIDNLSFSVVDKKQVKRTARQELALQPVYTTQEKSIKGNSMKELVLAFKPFTLSNTKRLKILISDKTGGRNLILHIKAKKLLRARLLKT